MPTNALGIDVAGLDVSAFLTGARAAFVVASVAWLLFSMRVRRPGWLLAGVLAANAFVWLETNYPLRQVYGLPLSRDRVGNLALCQVVVAGNSPIRSPQLGQLHFEPFWGAFVALSSGFDPERALRVYPFFALIMAVGFVLSLYFGLRPLDGSETRWERVIVAGFATLLSSAPFEYTGIYRQPWMMTFLLKPNHALGLVLFPIVLAVFARARGLRGRLAAGLLLHLLGWVFVLHMGYVCAGLLLHAALSFLTRHPERRRDLVDVAVTIGINVLVVSPYIVMLFLGYPFMDRNPLMTIAETSPHLLEVTARMAPWLALGAWGAVVLWRRGDRVSRVWVAQLMAALLIWASYLVLSRLQLARERDEIYYWIRFLTAALAGIGAWDLTRRAAERLRRPVPDAVQAAVVAALVLPLSLPYWWDPRRMDPYFAGSQAPLDARLRDMAEYLRRETPRDAVVIGDGDVSRYVSALAGRRVLVADNLNQPSDVGTRFNMQDAILTDASGAAVEELASYGARWRASTWYAVVTPRWLACPTATAPTCAERGLTLAEVRGLPHLDERAFWGDSSGEFVAIFRLRTNGH